jgi:hypothetical protein
MSERSSKRGDMGVDWDAEALRAASVPYPYTSPAGLAYAKPFVEPNDRLLEVGAQIASWLWAWRGLEPTVQYTGFDWSKTAMEIALKRYGVSGTNTGSYNGKNLVGEPIDFVLGDSIDMEKAFKLTNKPFLQHFDIVFTHTFYQHTSLETKQATVPQVLQALKPGGYHIIQENTSYDSKGTWEGTGGWIRFFEEIGFLFIKVHDIGGGGHGIIFQRPG